jgi:hypothetical protein
MQPVDIDTLILVASDGVDTEYKPSTHPGMGGYLVPGLRPGEYTLWITVPLKEKKAEDGSAAGE